MTVTNQNLVVLSGRTNQTHYPIWKDDAGIEYISLDGMTFRTILELGYERYPRETVERK
jgi:hypothetical protein